MCNRHDDSRRWPARARLSTALALLFASAAQAANVDIAPGPPAAPVSHLVRELLEQDAQRALLTEQKNAANTSVLGTTSGPSALGAEGSPAAGGTSNPAPSTATSTPAVQLQAIVGVERDLAVIVSQAGQRSAFRSGHAAPVAGADTGLRLIRVSTPCAVFRQESAQAVQNADVAAVPLDATNNAPHDDPALLTLCLTGSAR